MARQDTAKDLSDELTELGARIQLISAELRAMRPDPEPGPAAQPDPAPPQPVAQPAPSGWPDPGAESPRPTLGERMAERVRADGFASRMIAWVGGVITLVGLVLALALAIQHGYLGPLPRVLGGFLLATALVGAALRLHRTPAGRPGAYALAATGIAGIYLDVIAASTLYGFVPGYAGLLIGFAVAVAGLGLAGHWNSQLLACFVVLGCAACAPMLTGGLTASLAAFLLVLKAATAPVQLRRGWPGLAVAAALPALAATIAAGGIGFASAPLPTAGLALATFLLLGTVSVLAVLSRPGDPSGYGLLVSAPVPALIAVPLLPTGPGAGLAATVTAALGALWLTGLRSATLPARLTSVAGAATAFAALQASTTFTGGTSRTALLLAEALLLSVVAVRLRSKGTLLSALVYGCAGWLLVLIRECGPGSLGRVPSALLPSELLVSATLAGALGAAVAGTLAWAGHRHGVLRALRETPVPWVIAVLGVLYGSAAAVLNAALLAAPNATGFLTGHVLITLGWTVAGLAVLLRAGGSALPRIVGLLLAGAAVAKLALFDLAALDGMARVTVALGAGLALLLMGARYTRTGARPTAG